MFPAQQERRGKSLPAFPGSPAIGRGSSSFPSASKDQRGLSRSGAPVDIGAFQTHALLVVTTAADSTLVGLSLGDAVAMAMPFTSVAITFNATVFATPKTIPRSGTQLELRATSGTVTITGPAAGVTISGNNASRVFQVDSGVTAVLSGLTIANGLAEQGGGLSNSGNLTLNNVVFASNSARGSAGLRGGYTVAGGTNAVSAFPGRNGSAGQGGGLYSRSGSVTISNTTFTADTAQGGTGGGGGDGKPVTLPNGTTANVAATNGGIGAAGLGGAQGQRTANPLPSSVRFRQFETSCGSYINRGKHSTPLKQVKTCTKYIVSSHKCLLSYGLGVRRPWGAPFMLLAARCPSAIRRSPPTRPRAAPAATVARISLPPSRVAPAVAAPVAIALGDPLRPGTAADLDR